ncbi:MAG: hypothetical protein ACK5VE_03605 [Alphaproteobacteria bacterium]
MNVAQQFYPENPTTVTQIDPDRLYARTHTTKLLLANGMSVSQCLKMDPRAPEPVQTAAVGKWTLGADLIAFACAVNSGTPASEAEAHRKARAIIADASEQAYKILTDARKKMEEVRRDTEAEMTARVSRFIRTLPTIDVSHFSYAKCGVYFLYDGDDLLYVGQSRNVYNRIAAHHVQGFNRAEVLPCDPEMLDDLEGFIINLLRPPQNGELTGKTKGRKATPYSRLWRDMIDISHALPRCDEA